MRGIKNKIKGEVINPISDLFLPLFASLIMFCMIMVYFSLTIKVSHYVFPKGNIFTEMLDISSHTTGFALYAIHAIKSVLSYYSKG